MNTKQIEYIIELAKTQNFNRAAENLFISQPTLTYQIKIVEEEIGFTLFNRSGKGAAVTPAGTQFIATLQTLYDTLHTAIEQGQNFSNQYTDTIRIAVPIRSALYCLPQAIREFGISHPNIQIIPTFDWSNGKPQFLQREHDILFAMDYELKQVPNIMRHHLFNSAIYTITECSDTLSQFQSIAPADLVHRTLMVGGGSPPVLRALQQQLIQHYDISYFNSPDHDTTLTNVAAKKGICLAPGFLNDHSGQFSWIPFQTDITIPCSLFTHKEEPRPAVTDFVNLLLQLYKKSDLPL